MKLNYIIRYLTYSKYSKKRKLFNNIVSRSVYQPELQTYLFYGNNKLERVDRYINNKMIKKNLFIKALNSLNNFYLNIYMTFVEDQLMNFILYKECKSFYYLDKIGYYYRINYRSICKNIFKLPMMKIKSYFIYIKLTYEYTKNTIQEKNIPFFLFNKLNNKINVKRQLSSSPFNKDFHFYYDIINMLLNCEFISQKNKLLLKQLKHIIKKKYHMQVVYK